MPTLAPDILAKLRSVDTPTVCNALEIVMGSRTATGFTKEQVVAADPSLPPMVGFARTARLRAGSPAEIPPERLREIRLGYYDYVAAGEGPSLVVIEDCDWPRPVGAFWGEVNVAIHKGLGLAGTLTNGLLRDLGMLDEGYQVIAGGVGPSHAFVHVLETGEPVTVFGLRVAHDDLVHADRHGAVVLPFEHLNQMPAAIDLVVRREAPLLRAARSTGFTPQKLRAAWAEAEDVH